MFQQSLRLLKSWKSRVRHRKIRTRHNAGNFKPAMKSRLSLDRKMHYGRMSNTRYYSMWSGRVTTGINPKAWFNIPIPSDPNIEKFWWKKVNLIGYNSLSSATFKYQAYSNLLDDMRILECVPAWTVTKTMSRLLRRAMRKKKEDEEVDKRVEEMYNVRRKLTRRNPLPKDLLDQWCRVQGVEPPALRIEQRSDGSFKVNAMDCGTASSKDQRKAIYMAYKALLKGATEEDDLYFAALKIEEASWDKLIEQRKAAAAEDTVELIKQEPEDVEMDAGWVT
eukprot:TRINITY_DN28765_c0_g1_i1.p1 TRINITY_DN28765_c0_g1~~TRINITY_DN28765_c0_g1_i1.p1  ORF type:complete len:279 (+),score=13.85 TRINITY_DN28765_c0_g1_i1:47-883(+)